MTVIPTPGNITNVAGIPEDLKAINQWIVWKPVLRGKKLTKVPVSYAFPTGDPVDAQDHMYWCSFAEAVDVMQQDPRYGIGFVLRGSGIVCIDYDDHDGDDAEAVARGREYMQLLATDRPTYIEHSVSGKGQHAFIRGELPHGRITGEIDHLNWEVYAQQFIAITGIKAIGSSSHVANGQDIIDAWRLPPPPEGAGAMLPTVALGRRLDYTDAEVISTMMVRRTSIFNMMSSQADLHDRSTAFAQIVGDLDKITGDPLQIDRIIRKCPFMKNGYNREKYDQLPKWLGKYNCANMLEYWMKQARQDNTDCIPFAEIITPERMEFLKRVGDAIAYRTTVEAPKEKLDTVLSEVVKPHEIEHDVRPNSDIARLYYKFQDDIGGHLDELTIPPGVVGRIAKALIPMVTEPRLDYIIPTALSLPNGYIAQTFKQPNTMLGPITYFMVAGTSGTGKSSTVGNGARAVEHALHGRCRDPNDPRRLTQYVQSYQHLTTRFYKDKPQTVQGIFDAIQPYGAVLWYGDEVRDLIQRMMSPKDPFGAQLSEMHKELTDVSLPTWTYAPNSSRAARRDGITQAINLSVPSLFTTTPEAFGDFTYEAVVNGHLNRINFVYTDEPASREPTTSMSNVAHGFPIDISDIFRRMALVADHTASAYDADGLSKAAKEVVNDKTGEKSMDWFVKERATRMQAGASLCVEVKFSPGAQELQSKIERFSSHVAHDSSPKIGKFPPHYQLFVRTHMLVSAMATVLAVCDMFDAWKLPVPLPEDASASWRDSMPQVVVSRDHMQWAVETVMHFRLKFLKAWEQGHVATKLTDDLQAYMNQLENCLRLEGIEVQGTIWVDRRTVHNRCRNVAPYSTMRDSPNVGVNSATVALRRSEDILIKDDMIRIMKASELGLSGNKQYVSKMRD